MRRLTLATALLVTALAWGPPALAAAIPPKLPVEAFGKLPFVDDPVLSPDGRRIAARLNADGTSLLGVIDLSQPRNPPTLIPTGENEILWSRWAGNNRLLIGFLREVDTVYAYGHISQLMLYDLAKKDMRVLSLPGQGGEGDDVIHVADDGTFILVSVARNLESYPDVFRVDLDTGKWTKVVAQIPFISEWVADADGQVVAGSGVEYRKVKWLYRARPDEEFQTVARIDLDEERGEFTDVTVRRRGQGAYVLADGPTGRKALYELDLKTFTVGKLVFGHPTADVTGAMLNPEGSAIAAATYTDDRPRVEWLDDRMKPVQAEIDVALPNRVNIIHGSSTDRTKFLVFTGTASDPGYFYYYDHETGVLSRIGVRYEALKGAVLAPMQTVSYRSRDGLTIPAYLTLPVGRLPKGLPLVVMPHGGPFARDHWGFDAEVQFLANRGYAVLQPNYRGSTGYGREYMAKGFGQFGTGIINDINDGVQWLVADGTVDRSRVCIMGGSFGGYAAIWGTMTAPDIYRCAISFAGVTDLEDLMKHDRTYLYPVGYQWWRRKIEGDSQANFKEISPTDQADRLIRPLLLVHGEEDRRVPVEQAAKLARILDRKDKTYRFLRMKDVRHGFSKDSEHIEYLQAVDDFLARYNPAD